MSYLIVEAQTLADAADDEAAIGSTISKANATAAGPTTAVATAAEDEISEAVAAAFNNYAQGYHAVITRAAAAVNDEFAQAFAAASTAYGEAEAAVIVGAIADRQRGEGRRQRWACHGPQRFAAASAQLRKRSDQPLHPAQFPRVDRASPVHTGEFVSDFPRHLRDDLRPVSDGNPVGLVDAIGLPIAADTALVPLAVFIEGESVLETAGISVGNSP